MKLSSRQNRSLVIILSIMVVLGIIGFFIFKRTQKKTPEQTTPSRAMEQINKLAIKERPYITLTPRADGREVTLTLDRVSVATSVEYEMEYQAGAMLQGVFGIIDLKAETQPVSKKLLFGSCSKGKCKYDENVTGGSLTLRLEGGPETYVLKSEFNLETMADHEGVFTSNDIKASLDVGKTSLSPNTYVIVSSTMGPPAALEGEILAGPYSFLAASSPRLSQATLTIKSKEDLTNARLLFWDGSSWAELKGEVNGSSITAPITSLGTFVLVK